MFDFLSKLFFISLFLIQLPPFYFLSSILNIHTLSKIIILILFFSIVLLKNKRLIDNFSRHKEFFFLFLIFFISQSLSVFNAVNLSGFFERFEDFLFTSLLVFLFFIFLRNKKDIKKIIYILIFGFIVNFIFQLIIFFFPNFFSSIGRLFIHPGYIDLIEFNIERSRVYFESYDEILLPLFFYFLTHKNRKQLIFITYIFAIIFLSLISNSRTKFLMLLFGLISSFILYIKDVKKYMSLIILIFLIFSYSIVQYQITYLGTDIFKRISTIEPKTEEYGTIVSRIDKWKIAVKIGSTFPVFGAGLGNYPEYLSAVEKKSYAISKLAKMEFELATKDPHNIFFSTFAETGLFGLGSLILLLIYFIKRDIYMLKKGLNSSIAKPLILSFWILFIYALFNPSVTFKFQSLFWLITMVVEGLSKNTIVNVKTKYKNF